MNTETKRFPKWAIIVICISLVLLAVGVFFLTQNSRTYNQAQQLEQRGEYAQAREIYMKLPDYKDTAERVTSCDYQLALALEADGKYAEAQEAFTALGDYGDSAERVTACKYQLALALQEAGKHDEAIAALTELGEYGNAAEKVKDSKYQLALAMQEAGKHDEAVAALAELGEYGNAAEKVKDSKYQLALALQEAGKHDEAVVALAELGEYGDAAEKIKDSKYQLALAMQEAGKHDEAVAALTELGEYGDAAEKIKDSKYQIALAMQEAGKHDEAVAAFTELGEYGDAAVKIKDSKYQLALAMQEAGKHDEAVAALAELGEHGDAAEKLSESKYQLALALKAEGKHNEALAAFTELGDYKDSASQVADLEAELKRIAEEEELKRNTVIDVAGKVYTIDDVKKAIEVNLNNTEYVYSIQGKPFDKNDPSAIAEAKTNAVNLIIRQAVVSAKCAELGLDKFTDEELGAIQSEAEHLYNDYREVLKRENFATSELTGEELESAITDYMTEKNITIDDIVQLLQRGFIETKLITYITMDVTVPDADVQAEFDRLVAEAADKYADRKAFESAVISGAPLYYVPEDCRMYALASYVYPTELFGEITDINAQISENEPLLQKANDELAALGEPTPAETQETTNKRVALTLSLKELEDKRTALDDQLMKAQEALDAGTATIDEIAKKLAANESLEALSAEYGSVSGLTIPAAAGFVYADDAASDAKDIVFGIASVGEVSPVLNTGDALYIAKLIGEYKKGAAPIESFSEGIRNELLQKAQLAQYTSTLEQWIADADAKVYPEKLDE